MTLNNPILMAIPSVSTAPGCLLGTAARGARVRDFSTTATFRHFNADNHANRCSATETSVDYRRLFSVSSAEIDTRRFVQLSSWSRGRIDRDNETSSCLRPFPVFGTFYSNSSCGVNFGNRQNCTHRSERREHVRPQRLPSVSLFIISVIFS
uniref:Secreted protein n=1 Tax=Steinernema glaseri TaxID=37863 RepID=A0A1I7YDX3_9BILA